MSDGMCPVDLPVPIYDTEVHVSSLAGRKTEMREQVAVITETESTYIALLLDDVKSYQAFSRTVLNMAYKFLRPSKQNNYQLLITHLQLQKTSNVDLSGPTFHPIC